MSVNRYLPQIFALCGLIALSGCQPQAAPKKQTGLYRLFDLFQPEDLKDKVTPENAGWKRVEWTAQEITPLPPVAKSETNDPPPAVIPLSAVGYEVLGDLDGVKVAEGQLVGQSAGASPILHLALKENRGGAASVKFVDIRMRVSDAKQIWVRTQGGSKIDPEALTRWATQTNSWKGSADVANDKVQTYRFEIVAERSGSDRGGGGGGGGDRGGAPGPGRPPGGGPDGGGNRRGDGGGGPDGAAGPGPRGGGPPPGRGPPPPGSSRTESAPSSALRHIFITFRDGKEAKFSIDSVRLVSEKEEKLSEASGQQWAGLASIYHATLAAKSSESIRIPLRELPAHASLDFALGTKEDAPVTFKVALSDPKSAKQSAASVFERTVTIPNRWQTAKVDLSAYAGQSVLVEFSLAGEKKGLWGYWGNPVVRSRSPASTSSSSSGSSAGHKPRGVIVLLIDTMRKDHLNIYGYPRETLVHLKKFAEEGVVFDQVIAQATMTKISVPSIMTSLYPLSHTALGFDKGLPASAKTMAEVFREEGYATVAYSSVAFTGKANNMHQGYDELHESGSISDSEYNSKSSRPYVDRLIPWLEDHKDAPFFVFLHVFDPHSPYRPRPPYDTIWGDPGAKDRLAEIEADMRKREIKTGMDNLPAKEDYLKSGNKPEELLKIYTDWYDGSIRGVDAEVGRLLEALREMGLDKDTLMVWATDHGEELWDHGKFFHGHSVYGELSEVPLVFHWPNNPDLRKGARVGQLIENIDIMPTILSLAGITGPTNMQGRSVLPLLNGTGTASWTERPAITQAMVRDTPPGGGGGGGGPGRNAERAHFGVIDHGWKLVRKELEPDAQEELYEHPADALNLTNVAKLQTASAPIKTLNDTLGAWKKRATAAQLPNDDTTASQLSSEEVRRLRALGYLGGTSPARPSETNTLKAATNTVGTTNLPVKKGEDIQKDQKDLKDPKDDNQKHETQ